MNIDKKQAVLGIIFLLTLVRICLAEEENYFEQETLTNGFWGLNDQLEESGVEFGFSITNIYHINTHGGKSTNNRRGRHHGSYDLELWADLQKLLDLETGSIYMLVEGGWPDTEGIDAISVGSVFGVNADAVGNDVILVKELFYEGIVFADNLILMIGKIDFTGVFDASAYADDETTQFLNFAFVDDPTIPFPAYSLGIVLNLDLTDSWYLMGGVADAQADNRETGFRTTFHDEDYFFYAVETGITTELYSDNGAMLGTYRIGLWNDPQPKANSDGDKSYRDDIGVYTSCDQMLYKENSQVEDTQGLGVFVRYGYAPGKRNDITNFYGVGFQYQGLFDGRDDDVLGVAFAHGFFSNSASSSYPEGHEKALEVYYNAQIAPWFNFSPSIQYISNPGGVKTAKDAVLFGLRAQITF